MKAITLTQPWATLVALRAKRIETRSWRTSYRGPLAIHAAKGFPKAAKDQIRNSADFQFPLREAFDLDGTPSQLIAALPRGCVLATCQLIDCVRVEVVAVRYPKFWSYPESQFGNYTPGRWAWVLDKIERLWEPVPAKGALSLWEWKR